MNTQQIDAETQRIWRSSRPKALIQSGRVDWYRIENKADEDAADVFIYDEIGYFGVTAKDFVADLRAVTAKTINLHLNTPGGDVFDGIAIYRAIKNHPANVTAYVDGLAASAGSFIAMAADQVVMEPHSKMMIHEAFGLAIGNAEDMTKMAERLNSTSSEIASIYAEKAGKDADYWRAQMKAETWYTDQQAVDAGLADQVGRSGAKNQLNTFDLSIFRNAGSEELPTEEEEAPPEEEEDPIVPSDGLTPARRELEAAIAQVRL